MATVGSWGKGCLKSEKQAILLAQTTNAPVTDATKGRTSIIRSVEDLPAAIRVLLVTGYTNSTPAEGYQAAANFMAAYKNYSGPVAVILNDHDLNGISMNKATGGNFDPSLLRLVGAVAQKMLDNAEGKPVLFIGHSDGTSTLDRALGNKGKRLGDYGNLSIQYFGSPQLWSAADHAVHWTVRNGDPVTWLGSFWRFGASDTTRIPGWGHNFANYMHDAGGLW